MTPLRGAAIAVGLLAGCGGGAGRGTVPAAAPAAPVQPAATVESTQPPLPKSVADLLVRLGVTVSGGQASDHLSLSRVEAALGVAETRVAIGDPEGWNHSVYRLRDGISIVSFHDAERVNDMWWVPAGEVPLKAEGSGPSAAARTLLHCW